MNITDYIVESLQKGMTVEIPGIGTWKPSLEEAHFDEASATFYPTQMVVKFSPKVMGNEEFVNHIVDAECVGANVAKQMVKNYADALQEKINADGRVNIKGLGILNKGSEGLGFEADKSMSVSGNETLAAIDHVKIYAVDESEDPFAVFDEMPKKSQPQQKVEPVAPKVDEELQTEPAKADEAPEKVDEETAQTEVEPAVAASIAGIVGTQGVVSGNETIEMTRKEAREAQKKIEEEKKRLKKEKEEEERVAREEAIRAQDEAKNNPENMSEKDRKKAEKKAEKERQKQEKAEAKAKAEQEKAEAKAKAEQEKAEKKAREEREKAEKRTRDEQEKAERKAKEEQEKIEKKTRKEHEKAEKKARKEQEKAERQKNHDDDEIKNKLAAAALVGEPIVAAGEESAEAINEKPVEMSSEENVVETTVEPTITESTKEEPAPEAEEKGEKKKKGKAWLWILLLLLLLILGCGALVYLWQPANQWFRTNILKEKQKEQTELNIDEMVTNSEYKAVKKDAVVNGNAMYKDACLFAFSEDMTDFTPSEIDGYADEINEYMSDYIGNYLTAQHYTSAKVPMMERIRQYSTTRLAELLNGGEYSVERLIPGDDYVGEYMSDYKKNRKGRMKRIIVQTEIMDGNFLSNMLHEVIDELGLKSDVAQVVMPPAAKTDVKPIVRTEKRSRQGFDLIAGFYTDVNVAQKMKNRLRGYGCNAYIIEINHGYYVSMGSAKTRTQADAMYVKAKEWYDGDLSVKSF